MNKKTLKPLDFVKTPKGSLAIISEVNFMAEDSYRQFSIEFLGDSNNERCAWWSESELEYLDNLPSLLARTILHPFGSGRKPAEFFYPKER